MYVVSEEGKRDDTTSQQRRADTDWSGAMSDRRCDHPRSCSAQCSDAHCLVK
jgi:hypothetical protein